MGKRAPDKTKKSSIGAGAKQALFVQEYLIDLNATQAAIRAGYSKRSAAAQGHALLKKPEIQEALKNAIESRASRTAVTQDRVLQEIGRLAFFDPRRLLDANGDIKPPSEWDDDTAAAVASMEIDVSARRGEDDDDDGGGDPTVTKKVRVFDKNTALTNAMRHLGMFAKDALNLNHTGVVSQVVYRVNMPKRGG